jgi:hypothetical protein
MAQAGSGRNVHRSGVAHNVPPCLRINAILAKLDHLPVPSV